jgi:hypothetical protein
MRNYMLKDDASEKTVISNWINRFTGARNQYLASRSLTIDEVERLAITMQTCPIKNSDI